MSNMILPVDGQVRDALVRAFEILVSHSQGSTLNDRSHFPELVEALHSLTTAALRAATGTFLTVRSTIGARFDAGPESAVNRKLDEAVGYLRDTASSGVLGDKDTLSRYSGGNATAAYNHLSSLYNSIAGSIQRHARQDVSDAAELGPAQLVQLAEAAYQAAHPQPKRDEAP